MYFQDTPTTKLRVFICCCYLVTGCSAPSLRSRRTGRFQTSCFRFRLPPPLDPDETTHTHTQREGKHCLIGSFIRKRVKHFFGANGSGRSGVRNSSSMARYTNTLRSYKYYIRHRFSGPLSTVSPYLTHTHTNTQRWNRRGCVQVAR